MLPIISVSAQVLREIKALQHIDFHPNIVKLREIFPHGTGFVLVFEYMLSGESLSFSVGLMRHGFI